MSRNILHPQHSTLANAIHRTLYVVGRRGNASPAGTRLAANSVLVHRAEQQAASSSKAIEEVTIGDRVLAWNDHLQTVEYKAVRRLFRSRAKSTVSVWIDSADGSRSRVVATNDHPFWVRDRGWVAACKLDPQDYLLGADGRCDARVNHVEVCPHPADVFNFEVDGLHNYFVGRSGVLVHNSSGDAQATVDALRTIAASQAKQPGIKGYVARLALKQIDAVPTSFEGSTVINGVAVPNLLQHGHLTFHVKNPNLKGGGVVANSDGRLFAVFNNPNNPSASALDLLAERQMVGEIQMHTDLWIPVHHTVHYGAPDGDLQLANVMDNEGGKTVKLKTIIHSLVRLNVLSAPSLPHLMGAMVAHYQAEAVESPIKGRQLLDHVHRNRRDIANDAATPKNMLGLANFGLDILAANDAGIAVGDLQAIFRGLDPMVVVRRGEPSITTGEENIDLLPGTFEAISAQNSLFAHAVIALGNQRVLSAVPQQLTGSSAIESVTAPDSAADKTPVTAPRRGVAASSAPPTATHRSIAPAASAVNQIDETPIEFRQVFAAGRGSLYDETIVRNAKALRAAGQGTDRTILQAHGNKNAVAGFYDMDGFGSPWIASQVLRGERPTLPTPSLLRRAWRHVTGADTPAWKFVVGEALARGGKGKPIDIDSCFVGLGRIGAQTANTLSFPYVKTRTAQATTVDGKPAVLVEAKEAERRIKAALARERTAAEKAGVMWIERDWQTEILRERMDVEQVDHGDGWMGPKKGAEKTRHFLIPAKYAQRIFLPVIQPNRDLSKPFEIDYKQPWVHTDIDPPLP